MAGPKRCCQAICSGWHDECPFFDRHPELPVCFGVDRGRSECVQEHGHQGWRDGFEKTVVTGFLKPSFFIRFTHGGEISFAAPIKFSSPITGPVL